MAGPGSELGKVFASRAEAAGHEFPAEGPVDVFLDLQQQAVNTLLDDGHAWKGYTDRALDRTRRALRAAERRSARMFVLASFSWLRAAPGSAAPGDPLRTILETALQVEDAVLAAKQPACVLRLGYLYGPRLRDMRAYRDAFRVGRPYWSGPRNVRHDFLHHDDAASALLARAAAGPGQALAYATDGHPMAFRQVMDDFARQVGNPLPLHLGGAMGLTAWLIIKQEHMQAVKYGVPAAPPLPTLAGWRPEFEDYRDGLTATLAAWERD